MKGRLWFQIRLAIQLRSQIRGRSLKKPWSRLKTPLSLNIQYNLPKFPRIEYSFTTGSQLHLDFHSIFKYFLPTPPQIVGPQEPPLVLPQRPKHQLSSHRAHRGPRRRRHDRPALALLFLQVGRPFYSFYRWVALSTLSTQDLLRENCPHCAQIASSR